MRFIHMSDLHLGIAFDKRSQTKTSFKSRSLEITERFFECLTLAKEENLDALFITGDLFDHPHVPMRFVEQVFTALGALPFPVFVTIGNHDDFLHNKAYQSIRSIANLYYFDHTHSHHYVNGFHVYGFSTASFSEEKLREINTRLDTSNINVLCLHGEVFNPNDDHYLTSLNTLKSLNFDYIALGHIHKHQFLTEKIAYAGNLEPFDFSEVTDKGFILGSLKPLKTKFVKTNKRHYHTVTLTLDENDDAHRLKTTLDQALTPAQKTSDFIRLILQGTRHPDLPIDEPLIEYLAQELYYLEVIDQTRLDYNLTALKDQYQGTIIETVISHHEHDPQSLEALHKALEVLLKSEVMGRDH